MRQIEAILLAMLAVSAVTLGTVSTSQAAQRHSMMDSLVVKITKSSGIVWGKVTVDYTMGGKTSMLGSCKVAKCTFHPAHMAKLHLHESPTHPATWPFHSWKLANGHMAASTSMGKTLNFEIENGMATVWANYIFK